MKIILDDEMLWLVSHVCTIDYNGEPYFSFNKCERKDLYEIELMQFKEGIQYKEYQGTIVLFFDIEMYNISYIYAHCKEIEQLIINNKKY